jgi:hypothetical protein
MKVSFYMALHRGGRYYQALATLDGNAPEDMKETGKVYADFEEAEADLTKLNWGVAIDHFQNRMLSDITNE